MAKGYDSPINWSEQGKLSLKPPAQYNMESPSCFNNNLKQTGTFKSQLKCGYNK